MLLTSSASPEHSNLAAPGQGESTAKAPENLKFSCSEMSVCVAELQPSHVLSSVGSGVGCMSWSPSHALALLNVSGSELGFAVLDHDSKKLLPLSLCFFAGGPCLDVVGV